MTNNCWFVFQSVAEWSSNMGPWNEQFSVSRKQWGEGNYSTGMIFHLICVFYIYSCAVNVLYFSDFYQYWVLDTSPHHTTPHRTSFLSHHPTHSIISYQLNLLVWFEYLVRVLLPRAPDPEGWSRSLEVTYIHTKTHTHIHTHTSYMYIHIIIHTHIHHTFTYTLSYTHIHIHLHTHMCIHET